MTFSQIHIGRYFFWIFLRVKTKIIEYLYILCLCSNMYAQRGDTGEIHSSAARLLIFNTTLELSSSSRFYWWFLFQKYGKFKFGSIFHKPWDCEVWFNIPIPIDLVRNQNPTLASQYVYKYRYYFYHEEGEKWGRGNK